MRVDKSLLLEAKINHPEAVNDIEAVDLYALDAHRIAMQAKDEKTLYESSRLFLSLRDLYAYLLETTIVPD